MSPPTDLACPSWLAVSALTQDLLAAAAQAWDDDVASEGYIRAALAQPDVELDALVGAYRLRPCFGDLPVAAWFNPTAPPIARGQVVPEKLTASQALTLMVEQPILI